MLQVVGFPSRASKRRRYVDAESGPAERCAVPGGEGVHLQHVSGKIPSHTLLAQHRKSCSPRRLFVCQVCHIVFNKECEIINHKMALHRCEDVTMFSDIYLVMMIDFANNVKQRRAARKRQISKHKEKRLTEEMRAFLPGGGVHPPTDVYCTGTGGKGWLFLLLSEPRARVGRVWSQWCTVVGVEQHDQYVHDLEMFDYSDHDDDDDVNDNNVAPQNVTDAGGDADNAVTQEGGGKTQVYECDACSIMFASKNDYAKHLAGHKNEESFICEDCRTVFREDEHFSTHKLECPELLRQRGLEAEAPVPEAAPEPPTPPPSAPAPVAPPPREEMPPHLAALRADSPPPSPPPAHSPPPGPGGGFRCAICKEACTSEWALFEHLEMHPLKERRYPCDLCGQSFENSTKIIKHKNVMHRSKKQCENCGKVYTNKKDRREHVLTCVLNETHKCAECDVTCKTRVSLYFHMRTHRNREIKQCGTCGQKFNRKGALKWHVQTIHQNPHSFKCDICNQTFRYKKGLISHLSAQHNQGERKFECDVCGDKFIFPYRLKRHMLRHLRSRQLDLPFKCDKCDKSFSEQRYLDNHTIRIHLHKPHKCPDCRRAFLLKQHLDDHLRNEHRERPFQCELCSQCFTNKNRLQVQSV